MLGATESAATNLHFTPRLAKALVTAQRLKTLALPAAIRSLLWRSTILAQSLYGAEVRNVLPAQLRTLTLVGQSLLFSWPPIALYV